MKILKTDQYSRWFKKLGDATVRARIYTRIRRIELSGVLLGDWKPIAGKIVELRFDIGPGYRIYAHLEKDVLLLLLIGGDKSTQQGDIDKARKLLKEWEAQNGS